MGTKEAFYDLFTADPVNWIKWGAVFVILNSWDMWLAVPLYKKIYYRLSWERKRDIARNQGHVIQATLVKKHPTGEVSNYNWRATYQYTLDGQKRQYKAYFKQPSSPPLRLELYYLKSPDSLFSYDEYHWKIIKGSSFFLSYCFRGSSQLLLYSF